MMRDHLGLMWFGTWDGVNVFDGFKNRVYREHSKDSTSLRGSLVNSIIETKGQEIIVATSHGVNIFDRKSQHFKFYNISNKPIDTRIIKESNTSLLLSIKNELWTFDLNSHQFQKLDNKLSRSWDSYFLNSIKAVNHSEFLYARIYQFILQHPEFISKQIVFFNSHAINDFIDIHDAILFATDDGLWKYDKVSNQFLQKIPSLKIKSLVINQEQIYLGTQTNGILVVNKQNASIEHILKFDERNAYSLSGNFIRSMYIDSLNTLWASSLGNGVNFCTLNKTLATTILSKFDASLLQKEDNYIKTIVEDDDSLLWVTAVTGNMYLLNNTYSIIKTITPSQLNATYKPNSFQQCLLSPKNQLLCLSENGLYRFNNSKQATRINEHNFDPNQRYLNGISSLNDSVYLLASRRGVVRYTNGLHPILEPESGLNYSNVILTTYTDHKGQVYINPMFGGLDIYSYRNNQFKKLKSIDIGFNAKHYIENADTLWIATTKGILKLNTNTLDYKLVDESDGLPNQYVYCLLSDPTLPNTFWISSNKGIFRLNTTNNSLYTLGLNDGLSSLEFNTHAFAKRKNGDLVFGSIDGLTYLHPDSLHDLKMENPLVVFDLKFNNEYITDSAIQHDQTEYNTPYRFNTISFRLMQINFPKIEIQINYILEGFDKDWTVGTNPIEIRYPNLQEGDYSFKAKYYDRSKGWIEKTMYTFHINAPWYRTWWAYLLYIISFVLLVFILIRNYFKRKLYKEREELRKQQMILDERNRISADLHDDIGATLSSLYLYSDMANSLLATKPAQSKAMLDKIVVQSKELMQRMGDIIWSMKRAEDEKYNLKIKLLEFSLDLLAPKDIQLLLDIDESIDLKLNNPSIRKNILLIVKEAFNNVAKYSEASKVNLKLRIQHNKIYLSIKDDGKGFDINNQKLGNGLKNIEFRAIQLHGASHINSKLNEGTQIECWFPL